MKDDYDGADILTYLLILLLTFSSWAPFAKREDVRKEEEQKLKVTLPRELEPCSRERVLRTQRKKPVGKMEALEKEQVEHDRQRAVVLEAKTETQKALIETDRAIKSAREAGKARVLVEGRCTERVDAKSETSTHSPIILVLVVGSSLGLGVSIGMCVFGD